MQDYFGALGGIVQAIAAMAPGIGMLAVLALVGGGIHLWVKKRDRRKAVLMLALALVILGNVAIWTV